MVALSTKEWWRSTIRENGVLFVVNSLIQKRLQWRVDNWVSAKLYLLRLKWLDMFIPNHNDSLEVSVAVEMKMACNIVYLKAGVASIVMGP